MRILLWDLSSFHFRAVSVRITVDRVRDMHLDVVTILTWQINGLNYATSFTDGFS